MNIYFLVEGKKTEMKIYPAWLSYLVPQLRPIDFFGEVSENCYKIIYAGGQPCFPEISDAIREVNSVGKYDYLVICLDAEENSVDEVREDIRRFLEKENIRLRNDTRLVLIVHNRCIETWFLGNRRIFSRNPQNPDLIEYTRYYDVSDQDPELMGKYDSNTHARFHEAYLKALFGEKKISYSKRNPVHVMEESYLKQLLSRIRDKSRHLRTFREFADFCETIGSEISGGDSQDHEYGIVVEKLNNHRLKDGGFEISAESTDTGQIRPVFKDSAFSLSSVFGSESCSK